MPRAAWVLDHQKSAASSERALRAVAVAARGKNSQDSSMVVDREVEKTVTTHYHDHPKPRQQLAAVRPGRSQVESCYI